VTEKHKEKTWMDNAKYTWVFFINKQTPYLASSNVQYSIWICDNEDNGSNNYFFKVFFILKYIK